MRKSCSYLTALFFCLLLSSASSIYGCDAVVASAQTLVSNAEIVVRATAVKYVREPQNNMRTYPTEIEFRIEQVLKGENVPSSLIFQGILTDKDDYNDRPVPYDFIRRGGRGGSCNADNYKRGAEFLLFLVKVDEKYRIQQYPLAPINEQIRGKDDEWLVWVKNRLQTVKEKKENNLKHLKN